MTDEAEDFSWGDHVQSPPGGYVGAITVGSWNPATGKGFWSAELTWIDDDGEPQIDLFGAQEQDKNNITLDVLASLEAIRRSRKIELPLRIYSANDSVVRTVIEYMPNWKAKDKLNRGDWRNSDNKPVADLSLWHEIDVLLDDGGADVTWHKRPKDKRDTIEEFEDFRQYHESMREMERQMRRRR